MPASRGANQVRSVAGRGEASGRPLTFDCTGCGKELVDQIKRLTRSTVLDQPFNPQPARIGA